MNELRVDGNGQRRTMSMESLWRLFTYRILELPGVEIEFIDLFIFGAIVTGFYLLSRYVVVPYSLAVLEKLQIESKDRENLGKVLYVVLFLIGVGTAIYAIGVELFVFLRTVIFTFRSVHFTILDTVVFSAILFATFLGTRYVILPSLRIFLKRIEIEEDNRVVLLKAAGILISLAGIYLGLRYVSRRLLMAVLTLRIFEFSGVEITVLKLILFSLTVGITYLVSRYLVVPILGRILAWAGVEKEDRSTPVKVVHGLITLGAIFAGLNVLEIRMGAVFSIELFHVAGATVTLNSITIFLLVILASYLVSKFFIRPILDSIMKEGGVKRKDRSTTLSIVHYFTVFIGVYIGINFLGLQLTSLLAVAGVAGIVLGFGLQPIISNLVGGLLLMGERSVRVGDWVEFKNMYGVVVDTGIRASTVRTLDNRHILIPNSNFVQSPFTNYSHRDPKIRISTKVSVAYGSDVEKVKGILLDIAENNEKVLDLPEPRVVFQEFGNSSLNFELDCWIGDPKFRRGIKSEINFEIDRRFEENGIEIPFPQRDVHLKREPEVTEEMVEEEEDL